MGIAGAVLKIKSEVLECFLYLQGNQMFGIDTHYYPSNEHNAGDNATKHPENTSGKQPSEADKTSSSGKQPSEAGYKNFLANVAACSLQTLVTPLVSTLETVGGVVNHLTGNQEAHPFVNLDLEQKLKAADATNGTNNS